MRSVASAVADSLISFVSVNCGLQKVPGAGALRYGAKREVWKRLADAPAVQAAGVQADGTLLVR